MTSPTAVHSLVIKKLGITIDFAPVVDVSNQPDDTVIGDRSFSNNPEVVTVYADAYAQGCAMPACCQCSNTSPATGPVTRSEEVVTPPPDALRVDDLVPYQTLLDQGPVAVMVGHLRAAGLTG